MEFLQQRYWHTVVMREDEDNIIAKTDYADNQLERRAAIKVDIPSFSITEAWLERIGRPGDMAERYQQIKELRGIKAYMGSGRQLREALQDAGDELERSLFNEAVICTVQAETFLFQERGFADAASYIEFWEKYYAGSCYYYSHLDKVETSWVDFIGPTLRQTDLFNRFKSQQVMRDAKGDYLVLGNLNDTFHQMSTYIKVNQRMKVTQAHGQLIRTPDAVCLAAASLADNLPGTDLSRLNKKELAMLLGAGQGCTHIIDLIWDSTCCLRGQAPFVA